MKRMKDKYKMNHTSDWGHLFDVAENMKQTPIASPEAGITKSIYDRVHHSRNGSAK